MHGPKKNLNVMSNEIRKYIDNAKDKESKIALCDFIMKEVQKLKLPNTGNDFNDSQVEQARFEVVDHFDFMKGLLSGELKYEDYFEPGEISYDELIDDYLTEFWDLCDRIVDENTRFCWVEL